MVRSRLTTGLVVLSVLLAITPMATVAGGPSAQVDTNTSVTQSAGAGFAGAVGIEGAALENEQHRRTLNVTLARAQTPDELAAVIAEREIALDRQLDALEARFARLATARRTGRIERDRYRAQSAVLAAELDGIERRIGLLREAVARFPASRETGTLEKNLDRLTERARTLGQGDGSSAESTADDDDSGDDNDVTDDDDVTDDNDITDDDGGTTAPTMGNDLISTTQIERPEMYSFPR